jgi:hypothetical protein
MFYKYTIKVLRKKIIKNKDISINALYLTKMANCFIKQGYHKMDTDIISEGIIKSSLVSKFASKTSQVSHLEAFGNEDIF